MPNQLSVGQQQRVAIARALSTKPAIILATFMIATVFSVGISSIKNINIMAARLNGTRANVSASDISIDKIEQIRKLPGVNAHGQ